jgi:transposase
MKMIYNININTEIEVKTVLDLNKLKRLVEANNLGKPNYSKLANELGVDRRTVKKYYEGYQKNERRDKTSKLDPFYSIISKLLSADSPQIFYYKSHLYRYLVREHNLDCSRSNFNYYILKHKKFADYFKPKAKRDSIKSETPLGKQAQFDWKEKIRFEFFNGEKIIINVGSLVLSASQ